MRHAVMSRPSGCWPIRSHRASPGTARCGSGARIWSRHARRAWRTWASLRDRQAIREGGSLYNIGVRGIVVLLFCLVCAGARAEDDPVTRSNAIAVLGKPALPPDFPYFPYVNPEAPKGGEVRLAFGGTFDNFNPFILRGTSPLGMVSSWVILPGGS